MLEWLYLLGFSICHQLEERTISMGVLPLFVCARCSGIYIGYLIGLIFLLVWGNRRASLLPPKLMTIVTILFIVFLAFDGLSSYANLRQTTNEIRLLSGLLCGIAIAVFLLAASNYVLFHKEKEEPILKSWWKFLALAVLGLDVFFIILTRSASLFLPVSIFAALGVIIIYSHVNLIFAYIIGSAIIKVEKPVHKWLIISVLTIFLTAVELGISYLFHLIYS